MNTKNQCNSRENSFFLRSLLVTIFAGVLFASCHRSEETIRFSGILEQAETTDMIYLAHLSPEGISIIDSCRLKEGKFHLSVKKESGNRAETFSEPSFYQILLSRENSFTLPAKAGDNIAITADAHSLVKTYSASGSEDVLLMQQLDCALKCFIDTTDILQKVYQENRDSDTVRAWVESQYNRLVANHTKYLRHFIAQNPFSFVVVMAFYQTYNQKKFFSEKDDLELLKNIYLHLNQRYPDNDHLIFIKKRIEQAEEKIV